MKIKTRSLAVAVVLLAFQFIGMVSLRSAPRNCPVLVLFPEFPPPLFHESFDEGFTPGMTNSQITLGDFTYSVSRHGKHIDSRRGGATGADDRDV